MKYFYDDDLDTNLRIVPDTSVIIDGKITKIIKEEGIKGAEIIIHEAVLFELENQANNGFKTGFNGLNELKSLQSLSGKDGINITIKFAGRKPTRQEIFHAKSGDIDSLIRDLAYDEDARLITSDIVQKELAQAKGIDVLYIKSDVFGIDNLEFMDYFDDTTMSIHLKEDVVPQAKKGVPGNMELVDLDSKTLTKPYLQKLARQIIKFSKGDDKTFLEIDMEGSKIIQLREYRISIAETPFSEAMEITVVRPVANVDFEDYNLSDELLHRLKNSAQGVLISGSPGAGKSTFAQAVANYLSTELRCIVKTMESPRDLQVNNEITQYSPLEKDMQNTADVLLLVRPDYTIYDEVRKTHDFETFADMRLAGVGMIGVVHATKPIDAIQRIVSRVDLGVIPSVVDTTIFIDDGEIKAVYDISFTVKVPTGMLEADLSRPVVEISDFATGELKHEIYTYGEQTIVMDVEIANAPSKSAKNKNNEKNSVQKIAEKEILRIVKKKVPKAKVKVDLTSDNRVTVYVTEKYIPKIIGRKGKHIEELEEKIGISINVESIDDFKDNNFNSNLDNNNYNNHSHNENDNWDNNKNNNPSPNSNYNDYKEDTDNEGFNHNKEESHISSLSYDTFEVPIELTKQHLILEFGERHIGSSFDISIEEDYLFTATVGKKATVNIKRDMELSEDIINAKENNLRVIASLR